MSTLDRTSPPAPGRVRAFHFPDVQRKRLGNGLTVLSAVHGAVPVVTARVLLDAGVSRERIDQSGLAQLVARTIDTGTTKRDAEQISWDLEMLGAHLEAAAGWDSTAVSVTASRDTILAALRILAELVIEARFPEDEVERARSEQLGEIMQNHAEPRALANERIVQFIYGPQSTYGRSPLGSIESVERLTGDDVRTFHRERYAPADGALILAGAIDDGLVAEAAAMFERWKVTPAATADYAPGAPPSTTEVHIVDRPGSVQSEIRVGHVGVNRLDPDYFPLQIMNALLGGAFTSRLNMNLREKQGWTYGVRSAYAFRRGPGPFTISTAVGTETTAPALREILSEVDTLRDQGPTEEEVANMRDYLAGVMPLEVQTSSQLAANLTELFVYNLPDDYFQSYGQSIARVTMEDAHRVARQHIKRDQLVIGIVGDATAIESDVRALDIGPLQVHQGNE